MHKFQPINRTEVITLTAAGALAYLLFRKSAALGTLNFYPASVKDIKFEGGTPTMRLGIAAQNTSNQDFTLKSVAGSLYAIVSDKKNFIGNVSNFQPVTIPRNSQTTIYLNVRLSLIGVVNDIIRAFSTGHFQHDLILESYANIDNLQVPININYTVG